ncbi:CHAT domain-containing protein [Sphingobium sp.]|uniref:CHAT domain-containing protein n=1 Tax=Sphingobium sp. TaxID=1912891 RepID=UPI0028BE6514|nr:CHAT domain-containing protein [Sphingobium sp.]
MARSRDRRSSSIAGLEGDAAQRIVIMRKPVLKPAPLVGAAGCLLLAASSAGAAPTGTQFRNKHEIATFCAGVGMAGLPSPNDPRPPDPAIVRASLEFTRYWFERAQAEPAGEIPSARPLADAVNEQGRTLAEGFEKHVAPFYDLAQCDDARPSILWQAVPRSGPISLDRLADDREMEIFRSLTGRLRPEFARLSVRETFTTDVQLLALRHAAVRAGGQEAGHLNRQLGQLFQSRQIGVPALNLENAIASFEAASARLERNGTEWGLAQSGACFAYLTRILGDRADNLEHAVATCRDALSALDKPETRGAWANTQLVMAGALNDRVRGRRSDNMRNAILADQAALSMRSQATDPVAWATTQINLGAHLAGNPFGNEQANVEAAITAYEAAGRVITQQLSDDGWLVLQRNLAPVLARRDKGGLANNQETAIAMLDVIRTSPRAWGALQAGANYQLGQVFRRRITGDRQSNLEQAVRAYRQALLGEGVDDRFAISVGRALGNALIALGRYEEARDALKIARRAAERLIGLGMDEAQLRDVLGDAGDIYVLASYAAAKAGDNGQALDILSSGKARLLFTALSANNLDLRPQEKAELTQLRGDLRRRETELETLVRSDASGRATDVAMLGEFDAMRQRILALYEKGSRAALSQPSSRDVVKDGVLLAPVITEFGTIVLVARPSGDVQSVELAELTRNRIDPLIDRVSRTRRSKPLAPPDDLDLQQLQDELGATLGAAIRHGIAAAGIAAGSIVTIIPDGATAILPLALAVDPESGHALADDFVIRLVPSLAAMRESENRAARSGRKGLALLLPPQDAGLDFASLEGRLVEGAFASAPHEAWQNPGKAVLLQAMGTKSYWHLATHGWFDWDDARASGLTIGQQGVRLTLGDLLEARQGVGEPRLVVLSACSTGISEVGHNPDEFFGLPAGFMMAGAAAVVASLWPVDDLSTTLLMSRFYELHLKEHQMPATALRNAQIWLRDARIADLNDYVAARVAEGALLAGQAQSIQSELAPREDETGDTRLFEAPRHWAAFVVYGE